VIGTIIVSLDGSERAERALVPAAALARALPSIRVVVLTARIGGVADDPERYLADAASRAGIDEPEVVVVEDRLAASAIELLAAERRDPVVCLATAARGGVGQALFGSVAEETLRREASPTLLVGPEFETDKCRFGELVVCVDGSDVSHTIVPIAAEWAGQLAIPAVVVGVVDPGQSDAEVDELERAVDAAARHLQTRAPRVETRLLRESGVADAIVDFVSAAPDRFLALSTHGRTGLSRLTAGSVTISVVRDAPCPVLTVRGRPLP
jgi:nucleotide-binding universal stress UspA family protein